MTTILDKPLDQWTEEDKQIILTVLRCGIETRKTHT